MRIFFWLVLCCLPLLQGCGGGETPVERANREQVLILNIGAEPQNLDPHTVTGVPESRVIRSLMEGLVNKNPETLEPIPGIAQSWKIEDRGRRYLFQLRPGARWSNGDPVLAAHFVYAWRRILSPALGSEYAYNLYIIRNARPYNLGTLKDPEQLGIRALGPRTLEVTLETPAPYFLQLLDHYSAFPVHPPTIERFGDPTQRDTAWTRPGNFVGNGPFILKRWEINRQITVERNPFYWDAGSVKLNGIRFLSVENLGVEERMFRAGQLHITTSLSSEKVQVYKEHHPQQLRLHPYLGIYYYELNVRHPPLDDRRVRRALGLAIDRKELCERVTRSGEQPAYAMTPPGVAGYTPEPGIRFDPVQAQRLLTEAGFPGGKDFPSLELLYNTSHEHRKIAVAIQQMWKKHLGIDVQLNNQEWKVYLETRNRGAQQIARAGWIGDYPDPNNFLDLMIADSGNNRAGWANPEYDRLIDFANRMGDQRRRYIVFRRAEKLLMQEMPVIPLYIYTSRRLVHPAVRGWYSNLLDYHHYRDVHLVAGDSAPGA